MKFIVSSSELLKQLQALSSVINNNNTLPILNNFLFDLKEKQLTITASDLETTMTAQMTVTSDQIGKVAVPARLMTDILKTFPEQPLTLSIQKKENILKTVSEQGDYTLAVQNAEEFPKAPTLDTPSTVTLTSSILSEAINKTLFATGTDELRPVMTGVFFELTPEGATFVSTDAHKLVKYVRKDVKSEQTTRFIIPKKPLNLLKNISSSTEGTITIEYNETNTRFLFEDKILICRLIDGTYPNYEAVIPKENNKKLTLNRTSFLHSIKRLALFSNKTTHQVCLQLVDSQLKITAEDLDFSNKAHEHLSCDHKGDDITIGFNSRFLIEMLSHLNAEDITLEMSEPHRAGILKPVDGLKKGEEVFMLVMPIVVNT
ncbi:MAG: DNA polymerase III subunit beta [Flavobacteriales bacterium AspAUS03]